MRLDPGGELGAEDVKLVTLARSARARTRAPEAAAVRDTTGRTYVATSVSLPSLRLAALEAAVAAAVTGGAEGLEAAAVITAGDGVVGGVDAVRELGAGPTVIPVLIATPDGRLREILTLIP